MRQFWLMAGLSGLVLWGAANAQESGEGDPVIDAVYQQSYDCEMAAMKLDAEAQAPLIQSTIDTCDNAAMAVTNYLDGQALSGDQLFAVHWARFNILSYLIGMASDYGASYEIVCAYVKTAQESGQAIDPEQLYPEEKEYLDAQMPAVNMFIEFCEANVWTAETPAQ